MSEDRTARASVEKREELAKQALAAAVRANDARDVARVLEEYPEVRSKLDDPMPDDAFGATPLLGAVYRGNREMIDILLRAGADIDARSHWWAGGFGVLDHDGDLAPFLIERGATIDAHAAARLGMYEKLRELLSANPDAVHARGGDGQTPLHVASSVRIAEYLLDHGAEIDARDIDHESTPAQYMVRDRQEVARFLVGRGCRTDILMAAALGDLEHVRKHLQSNPECIRTAVTDKYFPKQHPRSGGSIYIWTLGADKTAHVLAREFGHEDVFTVLMEHTPDELKLCVACEIGDERLCNALLTAHPDLVQRLTDDDRRRIASAARGNETGAVRRMIAAGWPVDVRGQHGGTPLHWAAWHGNTEMVRELLRHGAPIDVTDQDHNAPPIGWALYGSVHGWHCQTGDYAGTVEALLQGGAPMPAVTEATEASEAVREVLRRYSDRSRQ